MEASVFTKPLQINNISTFDNTNMYDIDKNIIITFKDIATLETRDITIYYSFDNIEYIELGEKSLNNLYYIPLTSIQNDSEFTLYIKCIEAIGTHTYELTNNITRICKKGIENILYDTSFTNKVYAPASSLLITSIRVIGTKQISQLYYKIINGKDSEYTPMDDFYPYDYCGFADLLLTTVPEKIDPEAPLRIGFKIKYQDESFSGEFISDTFDIATVPTIELNYNFEPYDEFVNESIQFSGSFTMDPLDVIASLHYNIYLNNSLIDIVNIVPDENNFIFNYNAGIYGIGVFEVEIVLNTVSGYIVNSKSDKFVCISNNTSNAKSKFTLLNYSTVKTYDIVKPGYALYEFKYEKGLSDIKNIAVYDTTNSNVAILTSEINVTTSNYSVILNPETNILSISFNTDLLVSNLDYVDIIIYAYDTAFKYFLIKNRIINTYSVLKFRDISMINNPIPELFFINQNTSTVGFFDILKGFYIINPSSKTLDMNELYGYTLSDINNSSIYKFASIMKTQYSNINYKMYGMNKFIDPLFPDDTFVSNLEQHDTTLCYNNLFNEFNNLLLPRTGNLSVQPIIKIGSLTTLGKISVLLVSENHNKNIEININHFTETPLLYFNYNIDLNNTTEFKVILLNDAADNIKITFQYTSTQDIEVEIYMVDYKYKKIDLNTHLNIKDCYFLSSGTANYGIIGSFVFKQGIIYMKDAYEHNFISYQSDTAFKLFYNDIVDLYSNIFILNYVPNNENDYITLKLRAEHYIDSIINMNIANKYRKAIKSLITIGA